MILGIPVAAGEFNQHVAQETHRNELNADDKQQNTQCQKRTAADSLAAEPEDRQI